MRTYLVRAELNFMVEYDPAIINEQKANESVQEIRRYLEEKLGFDCISKIDLYPPLTVLKRNELLPYEVHIYNDSGGEGFTKERE